MRLSSHLSQHTREKMCVVWQPEKCARCGVVFTFSGQQALLDAIRGCQQRAPVRVERFMQRCHRWDWVVSWAFAQAQPPVSFGGPQAEAVIAAGAETVACHRHRHRPSRQISSFLARPCRCRHRPCRSAPAAPVDLVHSLCREGQLVSSASRIFLSNVFDATGDVSEQRLQCNELASELGPAGMYVDPDSPNLGIMSHSPRTYLSSSTTMPVEMAGVFSSFGE